MNKKIIFVYNAESGFINKFFDFAHKNFKPESYPCKLCSVTYGSLGMKKIWKQYVKSLNYDSSFLHKDEFEKLYPGEQHPYPSVFIEEKDNLRLIISSMKFEKINELQDLMKLLDRKLSTKK